jgi:hypothetical protein
VTLDGENSRSAHEFRSQSPEPPAPRGSSVAPSPAGPQGPLGSHRAARAPPGHIAVLQDLSLRRPERRGFSLELLFLLMALSPKRREPSNAAPLNGTLSQNRRPMPTHEAASRKNIDAAHQSVGWHVQDFARLNPAAGLGVAVSLVRFALHEDWPWVPFQRPTLIEDHVAASFRVERGDFEDVPFNQKDGLGRVHQVLAGKLDELLEELNEVLVA